MSSYTVVWLREAVDELSDIWMKAIDRNEVTNASAEIDRNLRTNPENKGKPLSEGLRVYDHAPLRAVFSVSESDRKVEVARVRLL